MNLSDTVNEYIGQENLWKTDGPTGVKNLCKLAHGIGYVDTLYFGQFEGASYGDLVMFLEDNQGCVEAIFDWIREQGCDEWADTLETQLTEKESEANE